MNILFLTQGYKPAYRLGGPILSVSALAETLVSKGHQVDVVTTNSNLQETLDVPLGVPQDVDGVTVRYFERKEILATLFPFVPYFRRSRGFSYSPALGRYLADLDARYDVVHTQLPFTYTTMAGARYAKRTSTPLFYNQRGVFHPNSLDFRSSKKKAYIRLIERPILDQANTLIALTQTEVDSYARLGTLTPARIVANGITPENYRTQPRTRPYDLPDDAHVVLFLGRIHPSKGAGVLLDAFCAVAQAQPKAHLVMAGPDEFELQATFRAQADARGLADRVVFPGLVSGEEKLDLLARADLFVLPSNGEGFSMAILEALASACAVLISPACNFPEVAQHDAGVVAPNTLDELSASLTDLLADPARLQTMGERGRELVRQSYSWDHIAEQMLGVYADGIERHRMGAAA